MSLSREIWCGSWFCGLFCRGSSKSTPNKRKTRISFWKFCLFRKTKISFRKFLLASKNEKSGIVWNAVWHSFAPIWAMFDELRKKNHLNPPLGIESTASYSHVPIVGSSNIVGSWPPENQCKRPKNVQKTVSKTWPEHPKKTVRKKIYQKTAVKVFVKLRQYRITFFFV